MPSSRSSKVILLIFTEVAPFAYCSTVPQYAKRAYGRYEHTCVVQYTMIFFYIRAYALVWRQRLFCTGRCRPARTCNVGARSAGKDLETLICFGSSLFLSRPSVTIISWQCTAFQVPILCRYCPTAKKTYIWIFLCPTQYMLRHGKC